MTPRFQWPGGRPLIMGVVNVTPDSFSDGGKYPEAEPAVAAAYEMVRAGADIIDVGGESTRPGAGPVGAEEELRRVMPVIERLAGAEPGFLLSVDTTKAAVAERALAAGARIVNDISALRFDPRMAEVVRAAGAGVVLMHMLGTPQTMQQNPQYQDVVAEVRDFLSGRVAWAVEQGVAKSQIAVDPGIGFGKSMEHNLRVLAHLEQLQTLGCPVVVGPSRKSFIGKVLGGPGQGEVRPVDQRRWGTAATVAWAVAHGASVVRVHDVAEMRDVVRMTRAILDFKS